MSRASQLLNSTLRSHLTVDEPSLRVLIVADVRLYREGMHASLVNQPRLIVVGTASNLEDALDRTLVEKPDIVIVDMATKRSLQLVRTLSTQAPDVRIVGFGVEEIEGEVIACAQAGLAAYVPCDASLDELVHCVRSVSRGELHCTPRVAATLFRRLASYAQGSPASSAVLALTAREREVVKLIERGLSNKEIATQLHIGISTVKNHVHNLLEKLHVSSRGQAVAHLGAQMPFYRRGVAAHALLDLD